MADERPNDKPGSTGRDNQARGDGRRRFGRFRQARARSEDGNGQGQKDGSPQNRGEAKQEPKRELIPCPLCGKPVYDLSTAVAASKETPEPAHFDCVLERVAAAEALAAGEKLVYLGSGSFGVVEYKDKSETVFTVKRRIQWEKEGEKKEWRKSLSSRITNL
jgi:hypothetical protein